MRQLLFDGHSLAYRAFYALPPDLKTTSGQVTNAVYGFTSMLIKALQDHKTEHIAVAFDRGAPLERVAIRPEYKAQRTSAPDEFKQQLGLIHEVLDVLKVPIFEIDNVEADDLIYILGQRASEQGAEVVVVTADRDFLQMVSPRVRLMMNRRGISDTVVYDEAAVRQRYGFGPDRYLDYAALRGDPSDNIQGVPGVGEKTAARLIQTHGTLEEIFAHIDEMTPKLKANLLEAHDRLLENRDFFRFRTKDELAAMGVEVANLDIELDQLKIGPWDFPAIRTLFDALEFRVLYERLAAERPEESAVASTGFEANSQEVSSSQELDALLDELKGADPIVVSLRGDATDPRKPPTQIGFSTSDGARFVRFDKISQESFWAAAGPLLEQIPIATHGSKDALQRLAAVGVVPREVAMDTEIAAYLVDPARGSYALDELARHYLGRELRIEPDKADAGAQQSFLEPETEERSDLGLEAIATSELSETLAKELRERGAWELFSSLELPLARVLASIEKTGITIDVGYLASMSKSMATELAAIEKEIYELAGGPFNIGSPPQLRQVLYERLGLKPSKKTKTGYSTDASVLETLREDHSIVDLILKHREKSKLKSTYLDALPPLVDPKTGRIHCRFNQTVAATGRLSSDRPNLQNIPIRTAEGRAIRRAFIPAQGHHLVVADYSQIELRILAHLSEDPELVGAFIRGDDIHRLSIAKALGIDPSEVTPELRNVGKMVSFGVTYGMGAFGLSQRLKIPVDQARTYIEGFFALYPKIREYLDGVVEQATNSGFTTTMLGRRRYVPELKSRNPRVKSLGERQALNAPIQGSAADILKLAMVRVDQAIRSTATRMLLTVHDELVFEAPEPEVEEVSILIREAMEGAIDLSVPLSVDLAWGPNWADAKN